MNRVEELNKRIADRNVGDTPQFYFSPRPVPTKYSILPIIDERIHSSEPIRTLPLFDISTHFLPGTSAPRSGVDLPKSMPSYTSDLYETTIPITDSTQPFPLLFASVRAPPKEVKYPEAQFFNNSTRLKNIY